MSRQSYMDFNHILARLSRMGYVPRIAILLLDLVLCLVAYGIAMALGSNFFHYDVTGMLPIWQQASIVLLVQTIFFLLFHTYAGILRYSTFIDTLKVLLSLLCATITILFINKTIGWCVGSSPMLNTPIILYFSISFVILFCLRVGIKILFEEVQQHSKKNQRVLVYGTREAGVAIAKMLRSTGYSQYRIMGFIEDELNDNTQDQTSTRRKSSYQLLGMHVYYMNERLVETLHNLRIQNVIVSPIKMKDSNIRKHIQYLLDNDIQVLTTPYFTNFDAKDNEANEATRIGKISAIQVEDLLERPSINIDTENVRQTLQNKVVMVTGAAGSIGSELVRQVLTFNPHTVILVEQAESALHDLRMDLQHLFPNKRFIPVIGDVRNRERIEEIMSEMRPDVIFHAAAYKHVPLMEDYPNEAIQANVAGTKNMADMAVKYDVKRFVMISTDKAVNPTNVMGASKRIAEIYVQSLFKKLQAENPDCTKFITTRFGNVLGSNGSVIPYFKKQIAEGGPVTVTHPDIIRYFMTIPEACTLVLEASTLGKGGEIFVFDMGQPVRILDLAKNMIRLAGYTPGQDIQIVFSGLRPGEKLYEELLNQKETTLPTENQKIMVAKVREFAFDEVSQQITQLIDTAHQGRTFETVALMKQIVPEYISKNSVFEQLDHVKKKP